MLEIDVDIGRLAPLGRDEPLEQQIGATGIDFRHPEAETDGGIGGRAASLAEDALRAREAHDVMDGEKVRRVLQLRDQLELVFEIVAHFVGDACRIAAGCTFVSEMRQRILSIVESFDLLIRILIAQFIEREGKRVTERHRFLDRFRRIAK